MATITVKHSINVCDLCGDGTTESSKQVRLGVDRKWFNLDLCSRHAGNVTSKLQEWSTAVGRSVSVAAEKSAANNTTAIREWAKANGHEVNERGASPAPSWRPMRPPCPVRGVRRPSKLRTSQSRTSRVRPLASALLVPATRRACGDA